MKQTSKSALTSKLCHGAVVSLAAPLVLVSIFERVLRFGLGLSNPVLITPDSACGYILKPDKDDFRFFSHNARRHRFAAQAIEQMCPELMGSLSLSRSPITGPDAACGPGAGGAEGFERVIFLDREAGYTRSSVPNLELEGDCL